MTTSSQPAEGGIYLAWWNLQQSSQLIKRDVIVEFAGRQKVVLNDGTVKYCGAYIQHIKTCFTHSIQLGGSVVRWLGHWTCN